MSMDAISYIHSVAWMGSRLGLNRIGELLKRMGNPERSLRFVHVAGTNGKGSTSAMIASILRAAGYRTGLFTSPYINSFHERIQVDGEPISDANLEEVTAFVRAHAEPMDECPTEFELVTAVGFEHFRKSRCDIVVLEVGLGGRLDSTNVIPTPECAVITSIGLDHTRELGDTLMQIAYEKGGIIKPGGDVVVYDQCEDVLGVLRRLCRERGARFAAADFASLAPVSHSLSGQVFDYGGWKGLTLNLLGAHQLKNAATALTAVQVLKGKGWRVMDDAVVRGLHETRWPGRFEPLRRAPDFIVDGGHNPQCAEALASCLRDYLPDQRIVLLLGVLEDKDYEAMLDIVAPFASAFVTVAPASKRALSADDLAHALMRYQKRIMACHTIEQGVETALKLVKPGGAVVAFGSLYIVGGIRAFFEDSRLV